jgi:PsbN protein
MDSAFFFPFFLWSLLLSVTIYAIFVGFGPPSKRLRDPFQEHEDLFPLLIFLFIYGNLEKTGKNKTK